MLLKVPANETYSSIVGPVYASSGQTIATFERNIVAHDMLRSFGHPFETCCDMLGSVNQTTAHTRALPLCTTMAK